MKVGKLKFIAAGVLATGLVAGTAPVSHAGLGDCSQPVTTGADPVATDCLRVLRVAVGTQTCSANPCICRPKGGATTKASDALVCLQYSVGQPVTLDCNCGSPDVQSTEFAFDPETDIADPNVAARFVPTDFMGAFSQDQLPADANWTQDWTVAVNGNNKVWHPATAGTLNGATPSANGSCPAGTTDIGDKAMPSPYTGSMDLCELSAQYSVDGTTVTLTNDNVYIINQTSAVGTLFGNGDGTLIVRTPQGGYTVPVTTHLVVEAGTLILGDSQDALVITRGSDIDINGTKANPVVMDSQAAYDAWVAGNDNAGVRGQWSGLALLGFGTINRCNDPVSCDFSTEGLGAVLRTGGTSSDWNCGSIDYLVIDNPGYDIDGMGNDTNGLTVYGCDYPTQLNHIQVNNSRDDGFEFFGGSAVGTYLVSTKNQDDNFDTDYGYTGGVQFGLAIQAADRGDKGFEADNGKNSDIFYQSATPVSLPNYANITVLNSQTTNVSDKSVGFGLRTWGNLNVWNTIQTGSELGTAFSEESSATTVGASGLRFNNVWSYNSNATATPPGASVRGGTYNTFIGTNAGDATAAEGLFTAGSNNSFDNVSDPGVSAIGLPNHP